MQSSGFDTAALAAQQRKKKKVRLGLTKCLLIFDSVAGEQKCLTVYRASLKHFFNCITTFPIALFNFSALEVSSGNHGPKLRLSGKVSFPQMLFLQEKFKFDPTDCEPSNNDILCL